MKHNTKRKAGRKKGFAQTDYVVAIGIFILVFALVIQYVSNYFSTVGDTTNIRVMNSQATSLLDIAERGFEPGHWPNTAANSSVVLLLHLDNSTLDDSQYGNSVSINGANCSSAVKGYFDNGCEFDGINDDITRPTVAGLAATNSVSMWFKPRIFSVGMNQYLLDQGNNNHQLQVYDADDNDGLPKLAFNGQIGISELGSANTWYHVAAIYDGTNSIIYINGVLDTSIASLASTPASITIGNYGGGGDYRFNGSIDEVVIYNRSLGSDEVYNLWAYENLLDRIGLSTRAYRFSVLVNNSQSYWKNQSLPVETISNELVKVNFTELGYGAKIPSVAVYEANGSRVGYEINGNIVTFRTAISANSAKNFTVYFDDDSTFPDQTQSITGVDNLSEVMEPVQPVQIIQNRKMGALENANYTRIKNSTGLPRDFGIRMNDVDASSSVLSFGPPVPPSGNVISFRRFALYQNATGAVRKARITIQVW
ncbi:MAG: hypothetical protein QT00_C0001G0161 [archaeon GW2011_AR5]|nr:MAG: hypothetical protein QT00_C0001G0161 [archaeon GW2011_AR5]